MKGFLLAALVVAVGLAGCLDEAPDRDRTDFLPDQCGDAYIDDDGVQVVAPLDDVLPVHATGNASDPWDYDDPWDFSATNYRTCTMRKVGHSDLREGDPHKYLGELDMRGDLDLGAVSAVGSGEAPVVYLVDLTHRDHPQVLSRIDQVGTHITDIKVSDDGAYLFTASQQLPVGLPSTSDPAGSLAGLAEDVGESLGPTKSGFSIYDIRDRTAPVFLQTVPSPDDIGCHMLSHQIIDGTDVVFCVGQQVHAYGLVRAAEGAPWALLGRFSYGLPDGDSPTSALPTGCFNDEILLNLVLGQDPTNTLRPAVNDQLCNGPHDMTVATDAVDGRVLMTVSHWNEGLAVVDVSDPVNSGFVTLARWDGEGAEHYDGNVHTAMTFWVGEHRYVVATPEMTYGGVVPAVWVLDATDLGDGTSIRHLPLVAEWTHPTQFTTPGLLMTTHQWQVAPTGPAADVADTTIYLTMNHLGVWALDFERILAGDDAGAIGGFHMSRAPLDQETAVPNAILSTWDVNVVDGYIYGSDRATGLWVFDYTADAWADPTVTGFA